MPRHTCPSLILAAVAASACSAGGHPCENLEYVTTIVEGNPGYFHVDGDRLVVTDYNPNPDEVVIFDISDPADPVELSRIGQPVNLPAPSFQYVSGDSLFQVYGDDWVVLYNISDPSEPIRVNTVGRFFYPIDLVGEGDVVYVQSAYVEQVGVEKWDARAGVFIDSFASIVGGNGGPIAGDQQRFYYTSSESDTLIMYTHGPASFEDAFVGEARYPEPLGPGGAICAGDGVVVTLAGGDGIHLAVFDVSGPGAPGFVRAVPYDGGYEPWFAWPMLEYHRGLVFASAVGHGVAIHDVSRDHSEALIAELPLTQAVRFVHVSNDHLFVGPNDSGAVEVYALGDCGRCPGDLAKPWRIHDLADIAAFVNGFTGLLPDADLDGNGVWDLADVSAFIAAFSDGC